ncbi:MAG TPA: class I SAM-dependent methyltransferase [Amphiplicatus sp.]|nr:class I SAM-dependent methyltransferase [Amphiplicatus sp.]
MRQSRPALGLLLYWISVLAAGLLALLGAAYFLTKLIRVDFSAPEPFPALYLAALASCSLLLAAGGLRAYVQMRRGHEQAKKQAADATLLRSQLATLRNEADVMRKKLAATEAQLFEVKRLAATRASGEAVKYLVARVEKIEPMISRFGEDLSRSAIANARHTAEKAEKLASKQAVRIDRIERARLTHHVHSRELTHTDTLKLVEDWATPLGVAQSRSSVRYLADRIMTLEHLSVGRLATDIQTILARIIAAMSLQRPEIHIVEIGVLFGIGAGAVYDACRLRNKRVKMTLIDPLKGYYDRSNADIITQVGVTREALDYNLAAMNVPANDIEIIQGMSEAPETLEKMRGEQIDLLIIDGDHSYGGVKRDFENYRPFMRPGGLILFDDYETVDWPDIKTFVDEEISPRDDMKLVAAGFRTALFRVAGNATE